MFAGKPIIGILGGIGSGKSAVAGLFGEMGCLVIKSDDQVRAAYRTDDVKQTLMDWWGNSVFDLQGNVDRAAVAAKVFSDSGELRRLEQLLHPIVLAARDQVMQAYADDGTVAAFVWDTPLLLETGTHVQCDALVYVDAPLARRVERVRQTRGWSEVELARRENLQSPLDQKKKISQYVIDNTADAEHARGQVKVVLSRILAQRLNETPR